MYIKIYIHTSRTECVCMCVCTLTDASGKRNGRENFPVESVWAVLGLRVSHQIFVILTRGCTVSHHPKEFLALTKHWEKHTLKTDEICFMDLVSRLLRVGFAS